MLSKIIFLSILCSSIIVYTDGLPPVNDCNTVCRDLPPGDKQPVCMMFSRYKKGYIYFANLCQARRAICRENNVWHMVNWRRCSKSLLNYMPIP